MVLGFVGPTVCVLKGLTFLNRRFFFIFHFSLSLPNNVDIHSFVYTNFFTYIQLLINTLTLETNTV